MLWDDRRKYFSIVIGVGSVCEHIERHIRKGWGFAVVERDTAELEHLRRRYCICRLDENGRNELKYSGANAGSRFGGWCGWGEGNQD